ncbi:MAG: hypothetical protein NWE99_09055 [Candidatus Bathyarchaeota archaeon]|nr:hypothetical protein [Candidatus Bathyarchaeota archaeon]
MKAKFLSTIFVALLVSAMFLGLYQVNLTKAQEPNIAGTSTRQNAFAYPYQDRTFYAKNRFWIFYANGTHLVYATSLNGGTWTSTAAIREAASGYDFSVNFDGTHLNYAYTSGGQLYYRQGTPNIDGTITWSAAEQVIATTYNQTFFPYVAVDNNGYAWIAYSDNYYPYIIKSGNTDGTWGATPNGFPYQLAPQSGLWDFTILPLTEEKMLTIYAVNGNPIRTRLWNGSAWGDEVATPTFIQDPEQFCAVAQGDTVHIAYRTWNGSVWGLFHTQYVYSSNSFTALSEIKLGVAAATYPSISIANNETLYCFWATKTSGQPSGAVANHIYYQTSVDGGSTWSAATDWVSEESEVLTSEKVACSDQYGNYITAIYMTKTESPYNVKFAFLNITPPDEDPPTFSSISANTTKAGKAAQLSTNISDNKAVSHYVWSHNNTGSWKNETTTAFTSNPITLNLTWNETIGNVVSAKIYANDTANNWAASNLYNFTLTQGDYNVVLTYTSERIPVIQGDAVQVNVAVTKNGNGYTDYVVNITKDGVLFLENASLPCFADFSAVPAVHTYSVSGLYDCETGQNVNFTATPAVVVWNLIPGNPGAEPATQPPPSQPPQNKETVNRGWLFFLIIAAVAAVIVVAAAAVLLGSKPRKWSERRG